MCDVCLVWRGLLCVVRGQRALLFSIASSDMRRAHAVMAHLEAAHTPELQQRPCAAQGLADTDVVRKIVVLRALRVVPNLRDWQRGAGRRVLEWGCG